MLVKILGFLDIVSGLAFLLLVFGISLPLNVTLFCAGILFSKSLFIFTGEIVLSVLDLFAAIVLLSSIFFFPPVIILWIPAFLLLAKGFISFL